MKSRLQHGRSMGGQVRPPLRHPGCTGPLQALAVNVSISDKRKCTRRMKAIGYHTLYSVTQWTIGVSSQYQLHFFCHYSAALHACCPAVGGQSCQLPACFQTFQVRKRGARTSNLDGLLTTGGLQGDLECGHLQVTAPRLLLHPHHLQDGGYPFRG